MRSAVIGFIFLAQLALGSNRQQATMDAQKYVSGIGVSGNRVSGSRSGTSGKSHKGTRCGKGTRSGKSAKGTRSYLRPLLRLSAPIVALIGAHSWA